MVRAMDEVIRRMPVDLEQAALALGSTKLEVAMRIVTRQMLPGIITAILLALGRGIGDAASVMFTAGYTDRIPTSFNAADRLPAAGGILSVGHALSKGSTARLCFSLDPHDHRFDHQHWFALDFGSVK